MIQYVSEMLLCFRFAPFGSRFFDPGAPVFGRIAPEYPSEAFCEVRRRTEADFQHDLGDIEIAFREQFCCRFYPDVTDEFHR